MGYLGTPPQSGFITTAKQRVTSSTNNYVDLDHSISSIADVIVFVNFVKQDTTNLTLTTSTRITLGGTLVSSDIVEIHYLGKAVNTQTPSAATVTSDMLAGSIANSKLANSSITLNGSAVSLGGSATISAETNTPAFHADRSGGSQLQFNSGAYGNLDFPTEVVDTNSAFASSTFTVPSGHAGKYFIYAVAEYYQNTYDCMVRIRKNGSDLDEGTYREKRQGDSSLWNNKNVYAYATMNLSVSDALTVRVYCETSDSQYNIYPKKSVHFGGFKITA
jgi:hypothetical protein